MSLTLEEKNQLLHLAKNSPEVSYAELGRVFGMTKQRVSFICRNNGIDRSAYVEVKRKKESAAKAKAMTKKERKEWLEENIKDE